MAMNELLSRQEKILERILMGLLLFVISVAIVTSYERFFIYQNFPVTTEAECDPAAESCFIYSCDPKLEECTGNPEEDTWYYKRITKQGNAFPRCVGEECSQISCAEGEPACEVGFCEPDGKEECSDREVFLPANIENKPLADEPAVESGSNQEGETDFQGTVDTRVRGEN